METIDTITARLSQAHAILQALPAEQEPETGWATVQGALWGADDLLEQAGEAAVGLTDTDVADRISARLYQARSVLQVLPVEEQPETSWAVVRGALWAAETLVEQAIEAVPSSIQEAA